MVLMSVQQIEMAAVELVQRFQTGKAEGGHGSGKGGISLVGLCTSRQARTARRGGAGNPEAEGCRTNCAEAGGEEPDGSSLEEESELNLINASWTDAQGLCAFGHTACRWPAGPDRDAISGN